MSNENSYLVPSETVSVEQEIKKSRFITTAGHAAGREMAKSFIDQVSAKYPDASHNCFAFVAGKPGSSADIGMGDDGEVPGTAGKPMLSVLQHKQIGEIAVVVTRYFGGIKLGPGGLVRAYTSSVQLVLDSLKLEQHMEVISGNIEIGYQFENSVRLILKKMGIEISNIAYNKDLNLIVDVPKNKISDCEERVMSQTRGQARINWHNE